MNKSQPSAQVSETREDIKKRVSNFTYFNEWDDETVSQLCQISKIKTFKPDQIILNGQFGQKSYVYFVTEGSCRVIECLTLPHAIDGDAKSVFINVCTLHRLSCFNIGENLKNRQIVTITNTECLLIPFYWLLERNEANIWVRIRQCLTWKIPKTETIVRNLSDEKKWQSYKNKLIRAKMKRNVDKMGFHDVPYSLKVLYY